jgi:hypothetical protein
LKLLDIKGDEVPMDKIAGIWSRVQRSLFPYLEECLPVLSQKHRDLVLVLETVRIEEYLAPSWMQRLGRKPKDRKALARAFVAKAVYNEPTSKSFLGRLRVDESLRRICGWQRRCEIPSESTFSRAFDEFATTSLADRVHDACVREYLGDEPVWHVSRDSTEIDAREKPLKKAENPPKPKYGRGRPRKGEDRPKPGPTRIERQLTQTAAEAIAELPVVCDVGTKIDSKGSKRHWVGYKLHVDVGDGGVPLSAVTTSASVHDSQVAIPLARITAERAESFYDLMDTAYDAKLIRGFCQQLGHVAIIPQSARRGKVEPMEPDRARRYNNRTTAERFNSRLKDEFGGRMVRVRGKPKVHLHLMFGVLAIFAEALLGLAV